MHCGDNMQPSAPMNFNDLDLNLLRVFHQLMMGRSASAAAESLDVSQPTISHALKRLRNLLGDELFVRTAHGMQPTILAEQIAEPIAYAIDTIRVATARQLTFDVATAQRTFVIGMIDLGEMYFLPPLLTRFAKEAPGVNVSTVRSNTQGLKEDMETGQIDVSMGLLPRLQGSFFRQRLFRQHFVLAFRKGHPLEHAPAPSLAQMLACQHAVVASSGSGYSTIDRVMESKGIARKVAVTLPNFNAVGQILCETDLVATVPVRMVQMLEDACNVTYAKHPVALPEVSIDISWHARQHRDPANQWLRRTIFDLFSERPVLRS